MITLILMSIMGLIMVALGIIAYWIGFKRNPEMAFMLFPVGGVAITFGLVDLILIIYEIIK